MGVAVLDTATGAPVSYKGDERFPMCSTFKLLAAAAVLARVDQGLEQLDRRIAFGPSDLLEYAPVTRARIAEGSMSLVDLCHAAITVSDNTAANLILGTFGGPPGLTAYIRSLGDSTTRLDRNEPALNEALPADVRDTTTPLALLGDMHQLLVGNALSTISRETLTAWLVANTTGSSRLRAGLPAAWRIGDKTGSGGHGTQNDVAIIWPSGGHPILVAAYLTESTAGPSARDAILADVARIATDTSTI